MSKHYNSKFGYFEPATTHIAHFIPRIPQIVPD